MINYSIPGFYELSNLNFKLLHLFKTHREYFYEDINIETVYGNPQYCLWDGGRQFKAYSFATYETIKQLLKIYNEQFNTPVRYVFTSCELEPTDYYNRFCNLLLSLGNSYHNEIVLVDDNLREYISKQYPNYTFISSTTKCITEPSLAKIELDRDEFKEVCLDYNLNNNLDWLKTLTDKEKDKVEFLVNAICPPACPHRKEHYEKNSLFYKSCGKYYKLDCGIEGKLHNLLGTYSHHITYDMIKNIYAPLGFKHFKLEGRTWKEKDIATLYCEYMVKPEYRYIVLNELL